LQPQFSTPSRLKRFLKILRNTLLIILGLIVALVIAVNLTPVQNFLARRAAETLATKLKTTVSVQHVRIDFFNHLLIQGLYIEDHQKDTLLYAGEARVRITDWFFLKKDKPIITYIGLQNAYSHLYRINASKEWNYQFAIDAFDNGKEDKTKQQNEFELDFKKVDLQNVRFHMDDAWAGSDMNFDIGTLALNGKELDLKKKVIDLSNISLRNTQIVMREYKGGKPIAPDHKKRGRVLDTTAFNPDNWMVHVGNLSLDNCRYSLTSSDSKPAPREFDEAHIQVSGINIEATNLRVNKDTLTTKLDKLTGRERCGLAIVECQADVTVSPNLSELKNFLLKTDKSVLGSYYAMHYKRFPDFTDYIHKVKMEAELDEAVISGDELGYFAPALRKFNAVIKGSGKIYGAVDSLYSEKLNITDGTSTVQGSLVMVGLPDIDKTFIHYTNGAIATTGQAIMRYAPGLHNNEHIDLASLSYIRFNGGFTGYISNFAANGLLQTNLGNISSNAKLKLPALDARKAFYSGTVGATNFNLGALLRQPYLGAITFKGTVSGNGFDPAAAAGIKVNAFINSLGLYGYNYSNITAEGDLARRKFDGKILVDDPNLALAFNGSADFSGEQPVIVATANLLKSELQVLKLLSEPVSAVADFDLNMTGSNIDNFLGSAKLYNINLLRGTHRVDLDSVSLNAAMADGGKMLTLESNDVAAHIFGTYQLSQLFYSTQYFLSGYLPNYIPKPKQYAPDQDLTFDITTRGIDSLLTVLSPDIQGFNNSVFIGSLNTTTQRLSLSAKVPNGRLGNIRLNDVSFDGNGNFQRMTLSGNAASLVIGDTLLNISVDFKTMVGNDSIGFNVVTSSPGRYGTATLNGGAIALGDSLYLTLFPSEVVLSENRWDINGGSSVVLAKDYLSVKNLFLTSGLQKVAIYTENERTTQSVLIAAENLDLAQLRGFAGLANYQPDGRVNGKARIDHLFGKIFVEANIKATGVKLGTDTIGTIDIAGTYDNSKGLITLAEGSGIFRGNASAKAAGTVSLDSSRQRLDGRITLNDAPISWVSPVLDGLVSDLGGTIDGSIKIGGTGQEPDVDGSVALSNAAFKVDYLGTSYTIPAATVGISNTAFDLSNITMHDAQKNKALLTGRIRHNRFHDFRLNLSVKSDQLEVLNLKDYENDAFYGNLTAKTQFTISGPFNNLRMEITVSPAAESHLYLPMSTGNSVGSYNYVTFKQYGTEQVFTTRVKNKLTLNITAAVNPLLIVTLILDPATGDQINARGSGSLRMEMPAGNDLKLFGVYNIDDGDYTFTFRQLFFKRQFKINSGSSIQFNGPIAQTNLDVNATYRTRASLYDLLDENEKQGSFIPQSELSDTKRMQDVSVLLHMTGKLTAANLSFKLELPEKRSVGTYAYTKLERINTNDRQLFDQVGSLLLIGYFFPPEGSTTSASSNAVTGAVNNMSEILSTTTSGQLTNIVNKLLGDPKLSIDLKYKNYNLSDGTTNPLNRNEVKLGLRQNFLNDRLVVELGSAYDWGRPTSSNTSSSNFNLLNNFRVQYLLNKEGRLRLNGFRTSDYDVLLDNGRNITRAGIGLSWRKTFDSFAEFIHSTKHYRRRNEELRNLNNNPVDSASIKKVVGTE
jgi:hypothetical protein